MRNHVFMFWKIAPSLSRCLISGSTDFCLSVCINVQHFLFPWCLRYQQPRLTCSHQLSSVTVALTSQTFLDSIWQKQLHFGIIWPKKATNLFQIFSTSFHVLLATFNLTVLSLIIFMLDIFARPHAMSCPISHQMVTPASTIPFSQARRTFPSACVVCCTKRQICFCGKEFLQTILVLE